VVKGAIRPDRMGGPIEWLQFMLVRVGMRAGVPALWSALHVSCKDGRQRVCAGKGAIRPAARKAASSLLAAQNGWRKAWCGVGCRQGCPHTTCLLQSRETDQPVRVRVRPRQPHTR
jgi:hypothetical protein